MQRGLRNVVLVGKLFSSQNSPYKLLVIERCPCYPLPLWSLNIHVLLYSHIQHTFSSLPIRADLKSHPGAISSSQPIISEWCAVSPSGSHVVKTSWFSNLWTKKTSSSSCSHPHIQYTVVEQGQGNLRTDSHLGKRSIWGIAQLCLAVKEQWAFEGHLPWCWGWR